MRLIAVNAGAVSQKLDKTRAGVLTNRPERANKLWNHPRNKKTFSKYQKSIFSEKQKKDPK